MSKEIHKSHNVSVLLYHLVFPAKYRRAVIDEEVDKRLKEVCLEIEKRYEITFLEIGTDKDHVHFFGTVSAKLQRGEDSADDQKPDSEGDISDTATSKEAVVGRGVLVRWVLREYGRKTWR